MTGNGKTVVLLMAYGSPNSLEEVGDYLSNVRRGRKPTQAEVERLKQRYREIGGRTPLLQVTLYQARALEQKLKSEGHEVPVYVGMKHWHPFIEDTVREIVQHGATSILGIALAPHYSRLSIGGYEEAVKTGLEKQGSHTHFVMVRDWHKEEPLIRVLVKRVRDGLTKFSNPEKATVLFTAHSLPKRAVVSGDPYHDQLLETSKMVAEPAAVRSWDFAFQSAGEPEDSWLGPSIKDQILNLSRQGVIEILVCPVGFVSDHLEILYDLDIEAKQYANSMGVKLERTVSLNDDPQLIEALGLVTRRAMMAETPPAVSSSAF